MGISNDEDLRLSESDAQETLPLYEEAHPYAGGELVLPAPTASPDQVRDFLVQLLQIRGNIGLDHARRIASRWIRGTGKELRSYPLSMFVNIFENMEDTWAVYREVRIMQYTKFRQEHYIRMKLPYIFLALSLALFCVCIAIAFTMLESDLGAAAIFGAFISFFGIIASAVVVATLSSPESIVEHELTANNWQKAPATAGPSFAA